MIKSTLDFAIRIHNLIKDYVGREWLLQEVDAFLHQDVDHHLIIIGEPGIGKSAFAAYLTQNRIIHAHHFCVAREGGTLDPIAFVRSLCHQLARSLPNFALHVIDQEKVIIDARQEIHKMEGGIAYNVYIDRLIAQTRSADEAFQYLIREPLRTWTAEYHREQVIFLVDALDEAASLDRRPNILDLIDSARDLPPSIYWLLTSRPGEHLATLPGERMLLLDSSNENVKDVRLYVANKLDELSLRTSQDTNSTLGILEHELVQRSGGNFLYLHYIFNTLPENMVAGLSPLAINNLPIGLNGIYHEFLDRSLRHEPKNDWRSTYRPILGIMTVAQEALDLATLVKLTGVNAQEVNDVLSKLSQFLDILSENQNTHYRIYHTSFTDFLNDQSRSQHYWIDPVLYNRQIADFYHKRSNGWDNCDTYGLRFLPIHYIKAGYEQELYKLLTASHHWMDAKFTRFGHNDEYRADINLALSAFADIVAPNKLTSFIQLYASLAISFHREPFYDEPCLKALVYLGNIEEALRYARRYNNFEDLCIIYSTIKELGISNEELLEELTQKAPYIQNTLEQVYAFNELAILLLKEGRKDLAEIMIDKARNTVRSIRSDDDRALHLCKIAVTLFEIGNKIESDKAFIKAEEAMEVIQDVSHHINGLIEMGRALFQVKYLDRALQKFRLARTLAYTYSRFVLQVRDLSKIAVALASIDQNVEADSLFNQITVIIHKTQWHIEADGFDRDPKNAWNFLMEALIDAGRLDAAFQTIGLLEDREYLSSWTIRLEFRKLVQTNQINSAVSLLYSNTNILYVTDYLSELALLFAKKGENEQAKEFVMKYISLDKESLLGKYREHSMISHTRVISELISTLVQQKRSGIALNIANTLRRDHHRDSALCIIGIAFAEARDYIRAQQLAENIQSKEDQVDLLCAVGQSLALAEREVEADVVFNTIGTMIHDIKSKRRSVDALCSLGKSLFLSKQNQRAEEIFHKAIELAHSIPDNYKDGWAHYMQWHCISITFAEIGLIKDSLEAIQSITADDDKVSVMAHVAQLFITRGYKEEANDLFENAYVTAKELKRGLYQAYALRFLAGALAKVGQYDKADKIVTEIPDDTQQQYAKEDVIEARIEALVNDKRFVKALELGMKNRLRDIDDLIGILSRSALRIEEMERDLSIKVLQEATRIAGWERPDWQDIHEILKR